MRYIVLAIVSLCLSACVNTQIAETNPGRKYQRSENVEVLFAQPARAHEVIAVLDAIGPVGFTPADLMNDIREKAKRVGADAVVIVQQGAVQNQQQLMYNPWLGGYQTIGGGEQPKMRAVAIKYAGVASIGSAPTGAASIRAAPSGSAQAITALVGQWAGTIRSSITAQRIPCTMVVAQDGKVLYLGNNGVRIDGQIFAASNQFQGQGTMYAPVGGNGQALARFPDGSTQARVSFTGTLTSSGTFSGMYQGGGDSGAFDFSR